MKLACTEGVQHLLCYLCLRGVRGTDSEKAYVSVPMASLTDQNCPYCMEPRAWGSARADWSASILVDSCLQDFLRYHPGDQYQELAKIRQQRKE
jgi:hypothetical protein